jgi:hypothetical protein
VLVVLDGLTQFVHRAIKRVDGSFLVATEIRRGVLQSILDCLDLSNRILQHRMAFPPLLILRCRLRRGLRQWGGRSHTGADDRGE